MKNAECVEIFGHDTTFLYTTKKEVSVIQKKKFV